MQTWHVMRQDGDGPDRRMGSYDTRVGALAQILVLETTKGDSPDGHRPHRWTHRVSGPPGSACQTNRDLYLHFLQLGQQARAASWSLSAYLRSLWKVSGPLSGHDRLEPDQIAAMFTAAAATPPAPYDPRWSIADLSLPGREPDGHTDWERVIFSQLADLEDFAADPPGADARFGVDAPRPATGGRRATPPRWLNFDPATYLECAVAGSVGGWDALDGARVPLPVAGETTATRSYIRPITTMSWSDLAQIAVCGQMYE